MRTILFLGFLNLVGMNMAKADTTPPKVSNCYDWRNGADVQGGYYIQFPVGMNPYEMHQVLDYLKIVGLSLISIDYREQEAKVYPTYGRRIHDRNYQSSVMTALQVFIEKDSIESVSCVGLVKGDPRIGVGN